MNKENIYHHIHFTSLGKVRKDPLRIYSVFLGKFVLYSWYLVGVCDDVVQGVH